MNENIAVKVEKACNEYGNALQELNKAYAKENLAFAELQKLLTELDNTSKEIKK